MTIMFFSGAVSTQETDVIGFTSDPYTVDDTRSGVDTLCTIEMRTDGTVWKQEGISAAVQIATWYSRIGDASEYEIELTQTPATDNLSGTWLSVGTYTMSANRKWGVEQSFSGTTQFGGTFGVRKIGEANSDTASVTLRADSVV